jgi:AcrR family transcriptional regulator
VAEIRTDQGVLKTDCLAVAMVCHHLWWMPRAVPADTILDAALALAQEVGWARVTARDIGARLGGGPELVRAQFRDLDAIADAWFARALAAALAAPADPGAPFPDRLATVMNAWLAALEPHRQTSLAMIRAKLYPSHPHHWVPLIFALSRLVQWMLDAAHSTSRGRRRQAEEIAVSLLVVETLRRSDAAFVTRRLQAMERRLDRLWPRVSAAGTTGPGSSSTVARSSAARSRPAAGRSRPAAARSTPAGRS